MFLRARSRVGFKMTFREKDGRDQGIVNAKRGQQDRYRNVTVGGRQVFGSPTMPFFVFTTSSFNGRTSISR